MPNDRYPDHRKVPGAFLYPYSGSKSHRAGPSANEGVMGRDGKFPNQLASRHRRKPPGAGQRGRIPLFYIGRILIPMRKAFDFGFRFNAGALITRILSYHQDLCIEVVLPWIKYFPIC